MEFKGTEGEALELEGTVAGNRSLLLSIQGNQFPVPANLSGSAVIYRVDKAVALADILSKFHFFSFFYI